MTTAVKRVGLVFLIGAAIGAVAGLGGAIVAGLAGLAMGGVVLVQARGTPDAGLRRALIVSATTGALICLAILYGAANS